MSNCKIRAGVWVPWVILLLVVGNRYVSNIYIKELCCNAPYVIIDIIINCVTQYMDCSSSLISRSIEMVKMLKTSQSHSFITVWEDSWIFPKLKIPSLYTLSLYSIELAVQVKLRRALAINSLRMHQPMLCTSSRILKNNQ